MLPTGSPQETGVLNPAPEFASFPQFSKFPPEIRRMIWQQAMSYERNINIELFDLYQLQDPPCNRQQTTTVPDSAPGRYIATVFNEGVMSALFHTTSESRQEAEEFYRVRVHGVSFRSYRTSVIGTLYLCPELDTININSITGSLKGFDEFATDVWKNDPKKIGLVNLGIPADFNKISAKRMFEGSPGRHQALKECIERLESIMFVRVLNWGPSITGYSVTSLLNEELNGSIPLAGSSGGFDCLETDPRPIRKALKSLYLGPSDPRKAVLAWHYLLRRLKINKDKLNKNASFGLCSGETRLIHCMMRSHVANAERIAQECMKEALDYSQNRRRVQGIATAPKRVPRVAAIGFWVFPLDSIGPLYEEREDGHDAADPDPIEFEFDRVEDMTKYPPKLYLCHLPNNHLNALA
ncbi:hypothetical protein ACHAPA_004104 [Fusarium lateritium]